MAKAPAMTSSEIELAVARHFGTRENVVVPNISWGWGLRHEADLIVLQPSGRCIEVEIKVSKADIKADAKKEYNHFETAIISECYFAIPWELRDSVEIINPHYGVLAVRRQWFRETWSDEYNEDSAHRVRITVETLRRGKLNRDMLGKVRIVTPEKRIKLLELAAMRIWTLKASINNFRMRLKEARNG